ncbi:DUF1573 domain-containing protein [Polaribacter aquimarinus]|mgnify:CR=1 FL=1|uniref:DUF1573 domain-containing protein n=1 Tax=Polaribacter aquimarinus TaxID=2100726 RepID=A0A2U2J9C4_9FLAO|nr:DUF1573 domain-containing protein [Polaribacter aquimarinus]PWG04861.1 hypothetical protein DIS07_10335 [Polaribacter aquimarinus]
MRKLITVFALVMINVFFLACNGSNAAKKINKENLDKAVTRDADIKKGTASISFDTKMYDFGTVKEGEIVEKTFKITNSGKTDLVITNAQSTCGCTIPVWPKAPIKPGETGDVKVKFNTSGKPNRQRKSITLTTNTESGREVLTIQGSVTPKAKK